MRLRWFVAEVPAFAVGWSLSQVLGEVVGEAWGGDSIHQLGHTTGTVVMVASVLGRRLAHAATPDRLDRLVGCLRHRRRGHRRRRLEVDRCARPRHPTRTRYRTDLLPSARHRRDRAGTCCAQSYPPGQRVGPRLGVRHVHRRCGAMVRSRRRRRGRRHACPPRPRHLRLLLLELFALWGAHSVRSHTQSRPPSPCQWIQLSAATSAGQCPKAAPPEPGPLFAFLSRCVGRGNCALGPTSSVRFPS